LFLLEDDTLLVNEVAPRPHNSGHFTFGACVTSQFEQHLRAICGLPLGDSSLMRPVVMVNLLGNLWRNGPPRWDHLLIHPQIRLHLYGKTQTGPGRKMGHFLLLTENPEQALDQAETLLHSLPQDNPAGSNFTAESSAGDVSLTPTDDQKEGEAFEPAGPGTHTALPSFPVATGSSPEYTLDRLRPQLEAPS